MASLFGTETPLTIVDVQHVMQCIKALMPDNLNEHVFSDLIKGFKILFQSLIGNNKESFEVIIEFFSFYLEVHKSIENENLLKEFEKTVIPVTTYVFGCLQEKPARVTRYHYHLLAMSYELLQNVPYEIVEQIANYKSGIIACLWYPLDFVGDFNTQLIALRLFVMLMKFVAPDKQREELAQMYFKPEQSTVLEKSLESAINVANYQQQVFETVARSLLNTYNMGTAQNSMVYSFRCEMLRIGSSHRFFKPFGFANFWIDLNCGPRTLSFDGRYIPKGCNKFENVSVILNICEMELQEQYLLVRYQPPAKFSSNSTNTIDELQSLNDAVCLLHHDEMLRLQENDYILKYYNDNIEHTCTTIEPVLDVSYTNFINQLKNNEDHYRHNEDRHNDDNHVKSQQICEMALIPTQHNVIMSPLTNMETSTYVPSQQPYQTLDRRVSNSELANELQGFDRPFLNTIVEDEDMEEQSSGQLYSQNGVLGQEKHKIINNTRRSSRFIRKPYKFYNYDVTDSGSSSLSRYRVKRRTRRRKPKQANKKQKKQEPISEELSLFSDLFSDLSPQAPTPAVEQFINNVTTSANDNELESSDIDSEYKNVESVRLVTNNKAPPTSPYLEVTPNCMVEPIIADQIVESPTSPETARIRQLLSVSVGDNSAENLNEILPNSNESVISMDESLWNASITSLRLESSAIIDNYAQYLEGNYLQLLQNTKSCNIIHTYKNEVRKLAMSILQLTQKKAAELQQKKATFEEIICQLKRLSADFMEEEKQFQCFKIKAQQTLETLLKIDVKTNVEQMYKNLLEQMQIDLNNISAQQWKEYVALRTENLMQNIATLSDI